MSELFSLTPIAGRFLIGLFFFFFGVFNAYHWRAILAFMQQKKIPLANYFLWFGILWQSITGLMLMLGIYVKLAALLLIPFDIVAVFIFHAFWNFDGEVRRLNMILFVANLTGSLGALLLLLNNVTPINSLAGLLT